MYEKGSDLRASQYPGQCNRGRSPGQEATLRDHAAQRGWEIVAVYRDLVVSGLAPQGRPAWQQFLADAGQLKPDILLVRDVSRLSRSMKRQLECMAELRRLGISLVGVQDEIEFSPAQVEALLKSVGWVLAESGEEMKPAGHREEAR
jgi:DNA invertase Pin-like site-specific DNA recombinase